MGRQGTLPGDLEMTGHVEDANELNLAERIRRVANGRTTLDVAQFQFIGLNEIRSRYGQRWPEKRERVQTVARHFISRRLDGRDVLIPGADGFLVVFGNVAGVLADQAANRISKELNDFFIGDDPEHADIRFEARRAEMSIDDLAEAFGNLIVESVEAQHAPPPPSLIQPGVPVDLSQVRFIATPVWNAPREAITTYFVTPAQPGGQRIDDDHLHPREGAHGHVDLDEMKLKASEEAIRRLFASGRRAFVGVSVHVSSLNHTPSLTRLFAVMSKFDKALIRYRVIRIAGVEPGFPRIYLEDIVRTLKARIPSVAVGLDWSEPDIASVLRAKPFAIGFALAPDTLSNTGPRAEVFARVRHAVEQTRGHDLPVFVEGEFGPEHAQRFAADGVQLLASPQIWRPQPDLTGAQRWPAAQLGQARDTAA